MNNQWPELEGIRCSKCGRFLGKGYVEEGEVYLLCKNCKGWTILLGGEKESHLTGEEIYARIHEQ